MLQALLTRFKMLNQADEDNNGAGPLGTVPVHEKEKTLIRETAELHPCDPGVDCEDCPNQPVIGATLPLCLVAPGESARIVRVDEGRKFRKRLADLGLVVGMEVRVVQAAHGAGPMILAVRNDSRLAVGWGMANKIRVQLGS
jgi:Fe2+ transport system protein FeoA